MRAMISLSAVVVLGICLSGCVAYDVASTAADATGAVVGTAVDVTGDVVRAPFGHDAPAQKDSD